MLQFVGAAAPQDRVRGPIFEPMFREAGAEVRYVGRHVVSGNAFSPSRSRLVSALRRSLTYHVALRVLDGIAVRVNDARIARMVRNYDVVHLIKVDSLRLARAIRACSDARLVYDLGDTLWNPRHTAHFRIIEDLLRECDAATCDNELGLAFARRHVKETYLWLPASQVEMFEAVRPKDKPSAAGGPITLGWIGSPATCPHLYLIFEALETLFAKHAELRLRLLGVDADHDLLRRFEHVRASVLPRYDREQMIAEALAMDIGLFPLFDSEDARVHGLLKALVYMAGGAAVVSSPVGPVADLVEDGVNGFTARSKDEWVAKLDRLVRDEQLRRSVAAAGLRTVRVQYSLRASFETLRPALQL